MSFWKNTIMGFAPDKDNKKNNTQNIHYYNKNNDKNISKKLSKNKIKFKVVDRVLLYGLFLVWFFVFSLIRAMNIKLGVIPWTLSSLLFIGIHKAIVEKRKKEQNDINQSHQNKLNRHLKINSRIFIFKGIIILLLIFFIGFSFYWFEYRPSQIRKHCYQEVREKANGKYYSATTFDVAIKACLTKNGIK